MSRSVTPEQNLRASITWLDRAHTLEAAARVAHEDRLGALLSEAARARIISRDLAAAALVHGRVAP